MNQTDFESKTKTKFYDKLSKGWLPKAKPNTRTTGVINVYLTQPPVVLGKETIFYTNTIELRTGHHRDVIHLLERS